MSKVLLIDKSVEMADQLQGQGQHSVFGPLSLLNAGLLAIRSNSKQYFDR